MDPYMIARLLRSRNPLERLQADPYGPVNDQGVDAVQTRAPELRSADPVWALGSQAGIGGNNALALENAARVGGQLGLEMTGIPQAMRTGESVSQAVNDPSMGNIGRAAADAGMMPLIMAGGSGIAPQALAKAFRASQGIGAGVIAGGAGAVFGDALSSDLEAQQLTRRQQRDLEMERQRQQQDLERQRSEGQNAVANEAARAEQARKDRVAEAEMQVRLENEAALRDRNKTFQENYPQVTKALPMAGLVASAGLPYMAKAIGTYLKNVPTREWRETLSKAEQGIERGSAKEISDATPQLAAFLQQNTNASPEGMWARAGKAGAAALTGGAASAEATMYPEQWNAANLPSGERQQQARSESLDWRNYAERGAMGAATGLSAYKAPVWQGRNAVAPVPQTEGILAKYGETPQSAQEALLASALKKSGRGSRGPARTTGGESSPPSPGFGPVMPPAAAGTAVAVPNQMLPGGVDPNQVVLPPGTVHLSKKDRDMMIKLLRGNPIRK